MTSRKIRVDHKIVLKFLMNNYSRDVQSLMAITEGETTQAFSFACKNREFVIRVNSKTIGFEKDKYAHDHFHSDKIPIPKHFQLGRLNDELYYSIAEKAPGKPINRFKKDEIYKIMPALFNVLGSIHAANIGKGRFGIWNSAGEALGASWGHYLFKLYNEFSEYQRNSARGSLRDQRIEQRVLLRYGQLIVCCPNIRNLVHGDYGFGNLLSDGKTITGVVDWENSMYGDFLYDAAPLCFWGYTIDYDGLFLRHYRDNNISVPMFGERVLCYKLRVGLQALRLFSESRRESEYEWTRQRLLRLL